MPCGGIYPSEVTPSYTCWYWGKPDTDHWVEEWDAPRHKACIAPFLKTEEGQIVIAHNHLIQIGNCVLQEEGRSMMDPEKALQALREAVRDMKYREDAASNDPGHRAMRARTFDHMDPILEFIKHFEALDEWLQKGGFLPADWNKNR